MAQRPKGPPEKGGRKPAAPSSKGLSDDDLALWEQIAKTAKPLRGRPPALPMAPAIPETATTKTGAKTLTKSRPAARKAAGPSPLLDTPSRAPETPELALGTVNGVDRRQAVRLRRGRLPIDGRLDLHGETQSTAHRRLNDYLARAQADGKRCVLVVTGRGVGKAEGGVLKAQVPRWLNQPPNRERVLAFDIAQPKHGGDGALYVLLKRDRRD